MTTVDGSSLRQRSTLGLVKDLTHQASTLVHQEVELVKLEVHENIELAKQEMAEKGKRAGMGVAALAAAGGAALLALGAFTAFLVLALDGIMPNWLAALCAALLWVVVAIPLALYGRKKIDQVGTPVPKRTIESVKEDVEWLKHQNS
jgi:MFS-type transporter involved in bile tolerance (Atg22 family)